MAQQQHQKHQQEVTKGKGCDRRSKDGSHLFVFTNDKAGMSRTGLEKERANRIIYEMSKNSSYFKQAELQDQKVDTKVSEMKAKLRLLDIPRKALLLRQADKIATELETQRELDSVCIAVDMDMFYAAVEIRDRPELADKPVAVGGEAMISTTNYHARKWGVRSAMPGFIGRRLCPELVFVPLDFEKYKRVAEQIRAIFREYDPRMRSYSLDEAYLNVTQAVLRRLQDPAVIGEGGARAAREGLGNGEVCESGVTSPSARPYCRESSTGTTSTFDSPAASSGADGRCVVKEDNERSKVGFSSETKEETDVDDGEEEEAGYFEREGGEGVAVSAARRSPREEQRRRARMFESARCLAEEIRGRIRHETKLTASIGIGPNFMLAKIASDWNKPNGQFCVGGDRAEVLRFLHDLPVRKVGGIGKVTEKCLRETLGVVTCGDLFRQRAACMHVMTPHTSRWLIKASLGIGSSDHDIATEQAEAAGIVTRKQISKERTFGELHRPQDLLAKCREICDALATEMATNSLEAKTVGLKIKTTKFEVRTHDSTGGVYVSTADELFAVASSLLRREIRGALSSAPGGHLRLRLMGVKASSFRGQAGAPLLPGQPTLDGFLLSSRATHGPKGGGAIAPEKAETIDSQNTLPGGSQEVKPGIEGERGARDDSPQPPTCRVLCTVTRRNVSRDDSLGVVTPALTSLPAAARVSCPVCGGDLGAVSNAALNRHVDACLGVESPGERGGNNSGGVPPAKRAGGGRFGPRQPKRAKAPKLMARTTIERFLGRR